MTTLFTLSCRNELGEELDKLGPYLNVILRPGSNWLEVQTAEQEWKTLSGASYARVLVEAVPADWTPPKDPVDWNAGW